MSSVAVDYIDITLLLTPQSSTLWMTVIGSAVMKQLEFLDKRTAILAGYSS